MSFIVREAGPEFLNPANKEAFKRIEESIRQYSVHSRETAVLIRNPFQLQPDHFALLWSRGAAVVAFYEIEGRIRASTFPSWRVEGARTPEQHEVQFENPHTTLEPARLELERMLPEMSNVIGSHSANPFSLADPTRSTRQGTLSEGTVATEWHGRAKSIAIFVAPNTEVLRDNYSSDGQFTAVTLEEALTRSVFHLPNLLRISQDESTNLGAADLVTLTEAIEANAEANNAGRSLTTSNILTSAVRRKRAMKLGLTLLILALLIVAAIVYFLTSHSETRTTTVPRQDSTQSMQRNNAPHPAAQTTVTIELPAEIQVFISKNVYQKRSELDRALTHGDGIRLLPSAQQDITMDSTAFAQGVYGYFKVDNQWRKGKLLQSFHTVDTFKVDNFLPPLQ